MRFPNASRGRWRALSPLQLLMLPNQYPLIGEQRARFPSGSGRARSGRRKLVFGTLAGLTAAASESGRSNAAAEGGLRLSDKTCEVLATAAGLEPATFGFEARCSIRLSDAAMTLMRPAKRWSRPCCLAGLAAAQLRGHVQQLEHTLRLSNKAREAWREACLAACKQRGYREGVAADAEGAAR